MSAFDQVLLLTMILGALSCVITAVGLYRHLPLHIIYPLVGGLLGIIFIFIIPVFSAPDENFHYYAAYDTAQDMRGKSTSNPFTLYLRANDFQGNECVQSREDYDAAQDRFAQTSDSQYTMAIDQSKDAGHFVYLAQAIGIAIALTLHLSAGWLALLGTLFGLSFFLGMMTLVIARLPFGKRTAFVIGLLPLTLQQATSFTYDGPMVVAVMMISALALYYKYGKGWQSSRRSQILDVILFLVSAVILLRVKSGVYAVFLLLPFFILMEKDWFEGKRKYIWIAVILLIVVAGCIVWSGVGLGDRVVTLLNTPHTQGENGALTLPLMYYMKNPKIFLSMLRATFLSGYGKLLAIGTFGYALGQLNIFIPSKLIYVYILLFILSFLRLTKEDHLQVKDRVILILAAVIPDILASLAMLAFWTPAGWPHIEGIQGRYFLPTLMTLGIGIGYWKGPIRCKNYLKEHVAVTKALYGMNVLGMVVAIYAGAVFLLLGIK